MSEKRKTVVRRFDASKAVIKCDRERKSAYCIFPAMDGGADLACTLVMDLLTESQADANSAAAARGAIVPPFVRLDAAGRSAAAAFFGAVVATLEAAAGLSDPA